MQTYVRPLRNNFTSLLIRQNIQKIIFSRLKYVIIINFDKHLSSQIRTLKKQLEQRGFSEY